MTELIHHGYARSAAALSDLTGNRVTLEAPRVSLHEIKAFSALLPADLASGEATGVTQIFSGSLSGTALLLLDEQAAIGLAQLLSGDSVRHEKMDSAVQEVIVEVGNILLNACLGILGNALNVQVSFAVPKIQVQGVHQILGSINVGSQALAHALIVHTRFQVGESGVNGYMLIVLGLTSLDLLLAELAQARPLFSQGS